MINSSERYRDIKVKTVATLALLGGLTVACGHDNPPLPKTQLSLEQNNSPEIGADPTPSTASGDTTSQYSNINLNMNFNLCGDQALQQRLVEVVGAPLACQAVSADGLYAPGTAEQISSSWSVNQGTDNEQSLAQITLLQGQDNTPFRKIWGLTGYKNKPLDNTPCYLVNTALHEDLYECYPNKHNLIDVGFSYGVRPPFSTFQSLMRLVIADSTK